MSRFAPALRKVAAELDLPRPARTAILLEMASDLEALFEHHRARGADPVEAARRAERSLLASPSVVRHLGQVHERGRGEWLSEVAERLSRGPDLVVLVLATAPMLLLGSLASARALADRGTPLLWVLLLLGVLLTGSVLRAALRGATPSRLRPLLVLALMPPAVGALSLTLGLEAMTEALATRRPEPSAAVGLAMDAATAARLAGEGAVLLLGLILGGAGAFSWLILTDRARVRAAREVDALLAGEVSPPIQRPPHTIPLIRRRSI